MAEEDAVIRMELAGLFESVEEITIVFVTKEPVPKISENGKEKESHSFFLEKSEFNIGNDDCCGKNEGDKQRWDEEYQVKEAERRRHADWRCFRF